jgi:hypothetical protein
MFKKLIRINIVLTFLLFATLITIFGVSSRAYAAKGTLPDEEFTTDYLEAKDKEKIDQKTEKEIQKEIKKIWKKTKPLSNKFVIGGVLDKPSYILFTVYAPNKDIEEGGIVGDSETVILIKGNINLIFLATDPEVVPYLSKISENELTTDQRKYLFGEVLKTTNLSKLSLNVEAIQNATYKYPYANGVGVTIGPAGIHGCNAAVTQCAWDLFNDGNNSVYASTSGIVTEYVICTYSAYLRIQDSDGNSARYVHLENNNNLIGGITTNLTTISAGTYLGNAKLGTFTDTGSCGSTSQTANSSHIHYYLTLPLVVEGTTYTSSSPTSGSFTSSNNGITNSGCNPPITGNWNVTTSCSMTVSALAPASVVISNNAVLTIPNGIILDIDFGSYNMTVQNGSRLLIDSGGKMN